ncbi:MAG: TIGR01212 family radical SAM protein [Ruminococcaceae bacterium]|nr:TIGR01212 family radical SAM protein [Oscillospiraceae bacterium]
MNPYPYSDSNKRYLTYDYYMKKKYGGKCAKIPLDAGFTCPNIDGRCGTGGCIYCSGRGSGDFAESPALSISEQYRLTREKLSSKWSTERCIAYFQAHTNTYAPLEVLKSKFEGAISLPGVVGISIATRADCLDDGVIAYINELSERIDVTVELGLQTVNDDVANFINRGHTYEIFRDGYNRLRRGAPRVEICIHLIFGLPDETKEMMLHSTAEVAKLHPNAVKIHLMHVIEGTKLAELYKSGAYTPMERQDYIDTVCEALTLLPEDTVIGRLTGDGMASSLLAPLWSAKKVTVLNDIDKKMFENDLWQGKMFQKSIN